MELRAGVGASGQGSSGGDVRLLAPVLLHVHLALPVFVQEPSDGRPDLLVRKVPVPVYDAVNLGFVTTGSEAQRIGTRLDVNDRGNGNQSHEYRTTLSAEPKRALIEYLKTW